MFFFIPVAAISSWGFFLFLKEVSSSNQGDFLQGERGFFQPTGIFPLVGEFQSGKGLLLLGENLLFRGREGYLIFGYSVRGGGGLGDKLFAVKGSFFLAPWVFPLTRYLQLVKGGLLMLH